MPVLEPGIHGPELIGQGPQKKENFDHLGPGTTQRNFGLVQTKKKLRKSRTNSDRALRGRLFAKRTAENGSTNKPWLQNTFF